MCITAQQPAILESASPIQQYFFSLILLIRKLLRKVYWIRDMFLNSYLHSCRAFELVLNPEEAGPHSFVFKRLKGLLQILKINVDWDERLGRPLLWSTRGFELAQAAAAALLVTETGELDWDTTGRTAIRLYNAGELCCAGREYRVLSVIGETCADELDVLRRRWPARSIILHGHTQLSVSTISPHPQNYYYYIISNGKNIIVI